MKRKQPVAAEEASATEASSGQELSDDELEAVSGGLDDPVAGAQAHAQDAGVHLPGGGDQNVSHEAWHVVQQKTGLGNG
ncbi:MAG: hypothetical protein AAGA81_03365 [Acidobacteriota bacterium]